MYIADELTKFLVCEICFELYDVSARIPLSLCPCGHTFCQLCIHSLQSKQCPQCNDQFQLTIKNWTILNLIPKPKLSDHFSRLRDELKDNKASLQMFGTFLHSQQEERISQIESIKEFIRNKSNSLIKLIDEAKNNLFSILEKYENDSSIIHKESVDLEISLKDKLLWLDKSIEEGKEKDEALIELEPVLNEVKNVLSQKLADLKVFKLVLFEECQYFKQDSFISEKLFGSLKIVESCSTETNLKETNEETYSEIENVIFIFIFFNFPLIKVFYFLFESNQLIQKNIESHHSETQSLTQYDENDIPHPTEINGKIL
jgi:hypothetical protein